jgi:prepilin-type N-terminal cleavage/methylation domain-containing protein
MTNPLRSPRGRRWRLGFTLVELMVVVVILGVLAAVASAAFTRYVKRSKTTEATVNLQAIYHGQVTYYDLSSERFGEADFVVAGVTPGAPPGAAKYPANITLWTADPAWTALGFSLATGHYYAYEVTGPGGGGPGPMPSLGPGDSFTALAHGDLDGDGTPSEFTVGGTIAPSGELQREPLTITLELE